MKLKEILMFACIAICATNYSNVYSSGIDSFESTEKDDPSILIQMTQKD